MAEIKNFADKKKGDKLTAHLALAAEENEAEAGPCLEPEQLADVAAGLCSKTEREQAMAHFATCRQCYEAWVGICFSLAAMDRPPERSRSQKIVRNFAWFGTAFAIAASVLMFVNVQRHELPSRNADVRPTQQKGALSASPPVRTARQNRTQEPMAAKSAPAPAPAVGRRQEMSRQEVEGSADTVRDKKSVQTAAEAHKREEVSEATVWLVHVAEACRLPKKAAGNWLKLQEKGRRLLAGGDLGPRERQRITQILQLLDGIGVSARAEERCRRILPLLAQGPGNW